MNVDSQVETFTPGTESRLRRTSLPLRLGLPFSERKALLIFGDGLLVNVAALAALWLWAWVSDTLPAPGFVRNRWVWLPLLTVAWWLISWLVDLYVVMVAARRLEVLKRTAGASAILAVCYLVVYFILPRNVLPRLFFLFFVGLAFPWIVLWRWTYATLFRLPPLGRRVMIVGAGWAGRTLALLLARYDTANYRAVGFIDDDSAKQGNRIDGLPVLGGSADLVHMARAHQIDEVAVAITHQMRSDLFQALVDCQAMGVHVVRMPDLYGQLTRQVPVEHINEVWILTAMNGSSGLRHLDRVARRSLDLVLGVLGLGVLVAILPLVALAIWVDDRGHVLYTQMRAGQGGMPFRLIKFRTMRRDAEDDGCARWAAEDDERITRVGRYLRKVHLDELPQVINVLRGEMSVVGPRPERPEFVTQLQEQLPFYRTRLVVKPGLTGWAQIHYRYGNTVQDALVKLQYDLYYIRHRSVWLDLYILFRTIGVVLRGRGV